MCIRDRIEENLALAKRRGERRTLRWGITRAEREELSLIHI